MDFILIPHFGQKHIAKNTMHDVIDLHQILRFTNNTTAPNVLRGKLLLGHGVRMIMGANATPSFQTGIIIPNSIAEGPPGNLKELITTHESEGARVIFSKVNGGIELMS